MGVLCLAGPGSASTVPPSLRGGRTPPRHGSPSLGLPPTPPEACQAVLARTGGQQAGEVSGAGRAGVETKGGGWAKDSPSSSVTRRWVPGKVSGRDGTTLGPTSARDSLRGLAVSLLPHLPGPFPSILVPWGRCQGSDFLGCPRGCHGWDLLAKGVGPGGDGLGWGEWDPRGADRGAGSPPRGRQCH